MSFYRAAGDGLRLRLKVKPQARRAAIEGIVPDIEGEALAVAVTAAPEDGKANAALIGLLARTWKLPAASFSVVHGATARRKLVSIAGDPDTLGALIEAWRASHS
ncbi:DUF167 domain-containing protein [Reyranella sp. CPCC 100927]|uniref:DUF167 domain-containing protein n=1 Tax=Reyranella sp. CPCC 100927 TaxID=2599616 RepID=UPI0011B73BB3|nr:DUF167 domain-containing protein [Reyranella sp. CPCC 100927]TWT02617.1 DUF167 domain-containing protein [Reyranella sp. CPCC 100927]